LEDNLVTLKDISESCKVSVATVSKALNGQSDVGEETSRRIRKVASELGYLPNASARALKTNRSHSIGVLFVDKTGTGLRHEYFSGILDSLKVEAESRGYDITFISNSIGRNTMSYAGHARYRRFDGVIIASADFKDPQVLELVDSAIPLVVLDYVFDSRTAVVSDNVSGMEELTEYIIAQGHRRIAFIHGEDTTVTQKRLASFIKTCAMHGISIPDGFIRQALYHDPKSSGLATRELLGLAEKPTCIIYPDDFSYIGGMNEIEKHGLNVPGDISVAGYDGILLSKVLRPRLTTFEQNAEEIGKTAAAKLIENIENPKTYIPETVSVKGHLIEGESVKALSL
jgi:LacI family transcriptional regulator